jgi:hypothetical protein
VTGGRTSPRRVAAADKQRQALELRRAGATYDAIAQQLGYTHASAAKKAVERALMRTLQEPADDVRRLEVDRLDRLMLPWWRLATQAGPDQKATEVVLKIMARRAKYLGLDGPKAMTLLDDEGKSVLRAASPEELLAKDPKQLTDEQLLQGEQYLERRRGPAALVGGAGGDSQTCGSTAESEI